MKMYGHANAIAERIVNAFKQPDALPQALAPIFIHRKDDVPCRRWSWHNQLVTALCGAMDARGIKQWASVGRKLKKGCHAIWILAPCIKKLEEEGDDGKKKERQVLYGFRSVPVFAVEDTEGDPLPQSDDGYDAWVRELPLLEVARDWNIAVGAYSGSETTPLGYFQFGVSGQEAVMLGVENLSTWAHEMVHAADHRLMSHALRTDRANREIVAELGGAILLTCLGMEHDADLGGAYGYIQRYAEESKKDVVRACIEVLDRTCNSVKLILDTAESLQEVAVPA